MKKVITMTLIFLLVFSSVPALANADLSISGGFETAADGDNDSGFDSGTALKVGGTALVVGGLIYLGRRFYRNRQAGKLYDSAQAYASRGEWGQAVETYEAVLNIVDDYEDTRARLAEARDKAEEMYINLGDQAREVERYEEARRYYHLALRYQPNSMRAQNRVDEMEENLVAIHYRRGHTFEVRGNWAQAYEEYQKAYNVNPHYQDLADRFHRARAHTEGEIPLRALMFVVNRTGQPGLERPFINALQSSLENKITDDFYMVDRKNIQQIMNEQGEALSQSRDERLARDIANLLGAQEIIMGQILELDTSSDEILIELELEIIDVSDASVLRKIEYEYEFDSGIGVNEIARYMNRLASELVDDEF